MTDLRSLNNSLLTFYPFSEDQLSVFTEKLTFGILQKKDLLLKRNEICTGLTYIIKGSLRTYTELEHDQLTINFYTENNWVADLESFFSQQPSVNCIEALEETEFATIGLKDLHALLDVHPCFRMLNVLFAKLAIPTAHMTSIKTKNPDQRYKELLNSSPAWLNRFAQHHIASYLGMTPETLSRVRARLV